MSLFNGLVNLGSAVKTGFGNGFEWLAQGENMRNAGAMIGGLGSAYGAHDQAKRAKKMLNLQVGAYNRDVKRQEEAEQNFNRGFGA